MNFGELAKVIWWLVWQSEQTAALPGFSTFLRPCTLVAYVSATPTWHLPHVAGMLARLTVEPGSLAGSTPCAEWQSEQVAAIGRPDLVSARAWVESM